jgi:hypothetical protein
MLVIIFVKTTNNINWGKPPLQIFLSGQEQASCLERGIQARGTEKLFSGGGGVSHKIIIFYLLCRF